MTKNLNARFVAEVTKDTPLKTSAASPASVDLFDRQSKLLKHLDRIVEWREILAELTRCKTLETPTLKVNYPGERTQWIATGDSTPKYTAATFTTLSPMSAAI